MAADDTHLMISQTEILFCVIRGDLGMGGSVTIWGESFRFDIVQVVVMQHGSPGQFPLVNIPSEMLSQFETGLRDPDAVAQGIGPVMLRVLLHALDPGGQ